MLLRNIILTFFGLVIIIISLSHINRQLIYHSVLEIHQLEQRRLLYPNNFGIFFENKYLLTFTKLKQRFFESLDINYYFFKSHPRERLGIEERSRFPVILLPFFLFGLVNLIDKRFKLLVTSFLLGAQLNSIVNPYSLADGLGITIVFSLVIIRGLYIFIKWLKII